MDQVSTLCGSQRISLQWSHNYRDGVSNHRRLDCLLNRLIRRRSQKTSKLRVRGFYEGRSPVTSDFPAQRASNAENVLPIDDVIMEKPVGEYSTTSNS